MSDKSDTGMPEDEKETRDLLALLYPDEEPGDASLSESSELISDDELSSMQTLRSIFRDMPEEEPSDAVTNKLLALAAQHAPKPADESKGVWAWFQGLFQPVLGHPGFAAAATMVLVVGVAGTLYVKGEAKLAEPEVASRAETAAPPTAARGDQPALPEPMATQTAAPGPASAEATATGGLLQKAEVAPVESADERQAIEGLSLDATKASDKLVGGRSYGSAQTKAPGAAKDSAAGADLGFEFKQNKKDANRQSRRRGSAGVGSSAGGGDGRFVKGLVDPELLDGDFDDDAVPEEESAVREQSPQKPAPPARPKAKPSKKPTTTAPKSEPPPPPLKGRDKKNSESKSLSATLHAKAVAAASRGDCATVLSLGRRIRKADSAYYDRTFLSDARLRECRASVQAESK